MDGYKGDGARRFSEVPEKAKRQQTEVATREISDRRKIPSQNTETYFPERLWHLHAWRSSKPDKQVSNKIGPTLSGELDQMCL